MDRAALGYGQTLLGFEVESGSIKAIFRQQNDILLCRCVSDCEDIMDTRQGDDAMEIIGALK